MGKVLMAGMVDTFLGLGIFLLLFAVGVFFVFIRYKFTGKSTKALRTETNRGENSGNGIESGWMMDNRGDRDASAQNHFE